MKLTRTIVFTLAVVVMMICGYSFLLGNEVFKGEFANDAVAWYFLAKGVFCSTVMCLLMTLLEKLCEK